MREAPEGVKCMAVYNSYTDQAAGNPYGNYMGICGTPLVHLIEEVPF